MKSRHHDRDEELPLLTGDQERKLVTAWAKSQMPIVLPSVACVLLLAVLRWMHPMKTARPAELAGNAQNSTSKTQQNQAPIARNMLATTAYWKVHSKQGGPEKSDSVYKQCMVDVMTLNTPFITYGDAAGLAAMQRARGTHMQSLVDSVDLMLQDLAPCSRNWSMLHDNEAKFTNDADVPSVDLGCVWLGKFTLLEKSFKAHPEYQWYSWMDVCMGHGAIPFPHGDAAWPTPEKFLQMPRDKIIVSSTGQSECEACRKGWTYCHCVSGTVFIVPRSLVTPLAANFSKKLDECFQAISLQESAWFWLTKLFRKGNGAFVCLSDQVILTKLLLDNPSNFFISSRGYGSVATSFLSQP